MANENTSKYSSLETQVAVLTEKVDNLVQKQTKEMTDFNQRQKDHHENVKKIGNDIGLLRLDVQNWSIQTQQVITDHKDIKRVIDNNTEMVQSLKDMVQNLYTAKQTTKSNITVLAKTITWMVGLPTAIYCSAQAISHWTKGN